MNRHSNLFLLDMLPAIQHKTLRVSLILTRMLLHIILVRLPALLNRRQIRRSPFIEVIIDISTSMLSLPPASLRVDTNPISSIGIFNKSEWRKPPQLDLFNPPGSYQHKTLHSSSR